MVVVLMLMSKKKVINVLNLRMSLDGVTTRIGEYSLSFGFYEEATMAQLSYFHNVVILPILLSLIHFRVIFILEQTKMKGPIHERNS